MPHGLGPLAQQSDFFRSRVFTGIVRNPEMFTAHIWVAGRMASPRFLQDVIRSGVGNQSFNEPSGKKHQTTCQMRSMTVGPDGGQFVKIAGERNAWHVYAF